jgi:hypothetical protein
VINKRLARLESVYGVSKGEGTSEDVAGFINHLMENAHEYDLDGIDSIWLDSLEKTAKLNIVKNLLNESGHDVSVHKISKGISLFESGIDNEKQALL